MDHKINEKGYGVKQAKVYRPAKKLKDQPHCFQKPRKKAQPRCKGCGKFTFVPNCGDCDDVAW